ncbi:MAG: hypothetical protein K2V38_05880, partial [Gemmataceae bacterium]|nr:hypothetical protein [Gemmataceae bacterium]
MPLRDHFHGPTAVELPWPMMAQSWAITLVRFLNTTLPRDQFHAVSEVRMGTQVEADVTEYRLDELPDPHHGPNGAVATLSALTAAPPA